MATAPTHIVVLTLENENFGDIVGNPAAPYLNSLIAQGMLFTNFSGESHPSQPNYLALFSGSTWGVTTNGPLPQFSASVPTLASALAAKGYTFGGYAETSAVPERQPWTHFANSAADAYNFSAFPQTAAGFANLPTVSFVTPNDTHNLTPLSDNGGGISAGDAWVQANISAYAAWAQANNSLLIITFDENNTNPAVTLPNHVTTIVVGAGVPAGVTNDSVANHYSLLNTIESYYGLTPIGVSAGAPALDFYSTMTAKADSTITERFSGISDPNNTPPQNALAAGPNYIFTAESSRYMVTDLNGNTIIPDSSLWSLFSGLDNTPAGFNPTLDNSLLDARAAYDSSTGRYVVIADNFQPGGGNFGTNIVIAVSVDSNPADGWYLASVDTSNGFTTQSDMPYLSVSNGNIYISTPEYLDAGGGYNTAEFVVGESNVIAAGNAAIAPNASNIASGSNGIMRNVAGANGKTYYLSAYSNHTRTILAFQAYDATTGSFSAPKTLGLDDSDVGGGGSDYTAAQLGTTKLLNINDSRIQGLAYASSGGHDYVYGVSEVMPSAGAPAQIEWFKLDVTDPANPQIVMGGVISGASIGAGVAVFTPSIAVDQNGDVLINFSASGPNMYPSDYYTVLGAGLSAFSAPTLYQASDTFFDSGSASGSTNMRWGTYSTAVADPNNPNGFWISNEYVTKTGVTIPAGLSSWWDTVTVQVTVSSSSPPSLGGAGVSATYTEGGAAATLDSGLTVSDPSSSTLSGATVTIASGRFAGDTLNFTNQNGITGSYNATTGALTLTGSASLAAYQTALDSVTFSSSSLNPTNYGTNLTRAINWQVSAGSLQSAVVSSSVNVVGVDQAPVLSGAGNTASYTSGGVAVVIDPSLAVSDPDNLSLASATVTIAGNFQSGDLLNFVNQNGISGTYNSATGVLALSGQATVAQYQTALDSVTFSTTSANSASRVVSWQVSDGTQNSASAASTVNIAGPPSLGGAGVTATYTEGGAAATLDSGLTVSDPSSSTLSGATVSIGGGFFAGDALNFTNQNGITGSYNATTGVLTLTGSASLAAYQTALDSVSFSSTSANPTNYGTDLARTINWQVSAGALKSTVVSSTVNVIGVDQAPVLSGAGNTTTYASGGVAVVIDSALSASDPDNLKLASATVAISNFQSGDLLNFANQNGITGAYNAATGVLTLSGQATVAQYQTALDTVTFSTSSANAASRVVSWQVSDGTLSSASAASTVNIAGPPSLGGAGVTATYTEGGAAATLDSGLTVSDPSSSTLSGATVTIATGRFAGDTLNFTNQNGITGSYSATTGVLTLAGTASLAAYQTALDSVSFSSTSANPTNYGTDLARTINWQVSAGSLQSAVVSSTVNVVGVDQAPVLSGAGNTTTYASGGVAVVIDSALSVSDPDNLSLASATVTISTNFQSGDLLNFVNQNGITGAYNAATGLLTLSGSATVAQYQTALDSVTFSTTSANSASRVVSWQVSDGTLSSASAASTVNIAGPPSLGGAGVTATYTEGGAAATLDSGLTVSDPSSSTLSGATVTIASGRFAGDTLNFINQNGITGSYNATTGVMTLTGSASLAAYQTALDSVSFSSSSLNPTNYGTDLARTINWQVSAGALKSTVVSSTVNVIGVDQRPVLSGAGNTTTYASGGVAVVIDSALSASDPDNLSLASATVTISSNFQSGDLLNFVNQNGITGAYNAATGVLTLSGQATVAQYQTALDSVTFSTSSANAASRIVSWQVSDGTQSSVVVTSTVSVGVPPTLGGAGVTVSYTQGGARATLDSSLTVADPSSTTLSGATVSIGVGFFAGDALNFTNQNGITGSYNATTGVLTLTGSASLAAYQTALDSVSFSSTSLNPTNYGTDLARTINWQVSAGALKSTVVSSTVNVIGVDQRPVLSGAGNTTTYTSGGIAVVIDNALAARDPDNLKLASATVAISSNFQSGDLLNFANQNGITGAYNATTGVLTLSGQATVAQYQTALDSVTFSTSSANAASRIVSWQVSDGTQSSLAVTSTVAFGSGGQTYTLTTGTDTISAGAGNDTIIAPSPSTLTSADSVNGGGGSNTLVLQGAGSYNLPSTLSNIQILSIPGVAGGTTSVSLSSSLDNLAIQIGQGVQNETFSVDASGSGNDTFVLTPNFGQLTIANFADSGTYADIVQFNSSMFSYLTPSTMTQAQQAQAVLSHATQSGGNVSITDSLGDRLTIGGTDIATLSANLGDFKFV